MTVKKKMLQLIKSFLIKLLNKEFNFINQNFSKLIPEHITDIITEYAEFVRFDSVKKTL